MSKFRAIAGYVLGGVMFVVLLPTIMWLASGMPAKGNPMDAFGHEVAPRTQHLMTDGPYRINRNPMLTGTLIYLVSFIVWLWTWQALLVWFIFLAIMFVQVLTEEKRLRQDFGEEYENYCRRTGRFLPWTCKK